MAAGHLAFIHNQMLLIVVGILMAIVAIVAGFELYSNEVVNDNRNAVTLHLERIAEFAQTYYKKNESLSGGGFSFLGFRINEKLKKDEYGQYRVVYIKENKLLLEGIGTAKANPVLGCSDKGANVTQQMLVRPSEIVTNQVH